MDPGRRCGHRIGCDGTVGTSDRPNDLGGGSDGVCVARRFCDRVGSRASRGLQERPQQGT
eukprot:3387465-Rhodomonas_salina.1